jgi:hypothetical protein
MKDSANAVLDRAERKYAMLCADRTVKDRVYAEIMAESEDPRELYTTIRDCGNDATLYHYLYLPSSNRLYVDGAYFLASGPPTEEGELRKERKNNSQALWGRLKAGSLAS